MITLTATPQTLRRLLLCASACLWLGCSAAKPQNLGILNGRLASCPRSPNCVSTQAEGGRHVEPLRYSTSLDEARRKLVEILQSMPGAKVVTEAPEYLHAEFTSRTFRFVDDVEAYLDDSTKLVHLRSASRLGYSDLGANRRRIEKIRKKFLAAETKAPPS